MHRISGQPDNPAFFDIRYPAGYPVRPDTGYPANDLLIFSSNKARKNLHKNNLVTRSCFVLCLLKTIIVKAFFKQMISYFTKNIVVKKNIWPDIRYPALTGYPEKQYPVHPYHGIILCWL
jgi:hypothetical protein